MKKQFWLTLCLGLALLPASAQAKTLTDGTSGIINAPSGYVRLPGHVSAGLDWTKDAKTVRGNVALPLGLEVAGSHVNPKHGDTYNTVSAKWQVLRETPVTPAIAIGVQDISDQKDRRGYIAASKALPADFKIHAGIGTDQYKHGFAALEKDVHLLGYNVTLMGEYDGSHFNYGAAVPVTRFLQAEVGVRTHHLYGGVNLTF
ncbi:YjbH domain-containing protein [Acidaminococcus sp. NSJ-142]|jgi:hypothetical protein|uniref:YjbH domain-containing protein n=1 Tax=Acidaminococcus TaxID=904 RepID=UPI000CF91405|nr:MULTISPECIES: YjbH domain-containing protein [Acidaminococcus]MCD2435208.1 YjbH domain-containing protein [Acidaminococcus hominis]MCH4097193.1 YjbH domain-containing protein [Acidaminococcus provencensis]RHK02095.1 hypothetical protein DW089_05150 [Acidaminococcus sp. AM05-11]